MDGKPIILWGPTQRANAKAMIDAAPNGHAAIIKAPTRSDLQNRKLWAGLRDISEQVEWHGLWLTDEEWKDVFTAALNRLKVVPGIDGGFVVVGGHTSKMDKATFAELLTLISAFGDERGVIWSEPKHQGEA